MTMLTDRTLDGRWFLPDSDAKVRGTLTFSPSDGIRLRVEGTFGDSLSARRSVIFGTTLSGEDVTLADCFVCETSHGSARCQTDRYYVQSVFVGSHLADPAMTPFAAYRVRFWNLEQVVGHNGLSMTWDKGQPVATGVQPPKAVAHCDTFRVETDYEVRSTSEWMTKTIDQQTYLNFFCQPALAFSDFARGPLQSMQTLIELAVDGPVPLVKLLAFPTEQIHPRKTDTGQIEVPDEIEILFQQRCPLPPREPVSGLPFTIASLAEQWEPCFRRWHEANTRFRLTFDHHFSLHRTVGMANEHRFISVVQALESYHQHAFPHRVRQPKCEFRERKRRMSKTFDPSDRRWFVKAVEYANEITLRDRLSDLWRLMPEGARQRLGAEDDFCARVKDTRNWLTHGRRVKGAAVSSGVEMTDLRMQCDLVLRLLFIRELGVDPQQVLGTTWGQRLLAALR
jgi:hypothetical protein